MDLTIEQIKEKLRKTAGRPIGKHRFFSVLVPFVERDGDVCLLFEIRSEDMKSDPGEICFPGGHMEQGEDPAECALRETFEEIGIAQDQVEIFGQGKILYGYANYTLYTHLGRIRYEDYINARLQKEEVKDIFLVPLQHFFVQEPKVFRQKVSAEISEDFPYEEIGIDENYKWRSGQWDIPVYHVEGRTIWGLTARITADIVKTLKESENVFTH